MFAKRPLRLGAFLVAKAERALDPAYIWFGRLDPAGEPEIARDFCRQARSLDSPHANFDFLWLDALSRIAAEDVRSAHPAHANGLTTVTPS